MISSAVRIFAIARNTLTEALRQKVLNVLLIFALVLVGGSVGVSALAVPQMGDNSALYSEQIKFVKDAGCGAISIFGFAIALFSVAQLIPQELQNRTIYTILAKPVRRSEFLIGKFFGVVMLLLACVSIMSLAFAVALYFQEFKDLVMTDAVYHRGTPGWDSNPTLLSAYQHDVQGIVSQARDPQLVEAILLIFAKLVLMAGIALLISTFATSPIFTIVTTFMIYLIGHLEGTARSAWLAQGAEGNFWLGLLVSFVSMLIPDMNSFTIVDEILAGNLVPWAHVLSLLGYASVYLLVVLSVSVLIFDHREI